MVVSEKGWYGLLYWYYSVASLGGHVYLRNTGCVRIWKSSCVGCSGFSEKIPLTVRFQYVLVTLSSKQMITSFMTWVENCDDC